MRAGCCFIVPRAAPGGSPINTNYLRQQTSDWPLLARKRRGITNHQITESIHLVRLNAAQRYKLTADTALHWVPWAELDLITLSGPHRRWIREIEKHEIEL